MIAMNRRSWIAVAIAAAVTIAALVAVGRMWAAIGDVELGFAGWLALILGVVFAFALGVGLMALLFVSERKGFDEPGEWR